MSFAGIPDNDDWADCRYCGSPCGGRCVFSHGPCPPAVDKHHLPAELAAQMLEREAALGVPEIDPVLRELLECLAEECAETIQRCTKILRFGMRENPWTGKHNRDTLESELGDIGAFVTLLDLAGITSTGRISRHQVAKIEALARPDGRLRAARHVAARYMAERIPGKYDERDE